MKPLFHFADLWKCFVKLFKNVDRVTTEDGTTLYAKDNLAIDGNLGVSGDVLIEGSINGEENPSVKPVYFHPIVIIQETHADTSDVESRCNLFILDNNPTPYTVETLTSKLTDLLEAGAYILMNGYYKSGSTIYNLYSLQKFSKGIYKFYGNDTTGRGSVDLTDILNNRCNMNDGVNKIN